LSPAFTPRSAFRVPRFRLTVTDTGPGIPPEIRPHIFDPFFSGREAGRGLGLGLSKAWRIVELHGGLIEVASDNGHGAKFTVVLPG
jgi:signal transduction histidine kinase